jgi:hypothetical protein
MNHDEFEHKLMNMLLAGDDEMLMKLQKQYQSATIVSREISDVGFFTKYAIPQRNDLHIDRKSFAFGDVDGMVDGKEGAVGFVLFVDNGYISVLEGYTCVIDKWPQSYDEIMLVYYSGEERDFTRLKKQW